MLTAIVGVNWGDEGKGRYVDLLSENYDIVVRYQGGNNAGHTVITPAGKFVLNLIPSGILRPDTVNVLGLGMVVDLEHLHTEVCRLRERNVVVTPKNLKLSEKAVVCMPYHKLLDEYEEDRLGEKKQGSTRRGIAPAYSDKYMRKALRVGDLLDHAGMLAALEPVISHTNVLMRGYGKPEIDRGELLAWLDKYGSFASQFVCDTESYLENAIDAGKNILFEAQLGTMRDVDFGIYPYTTSSSALAAYAPIGAGVPGRRLDRVVGVVKAYSSSVGGGPFVSEFTDKKEAEELRERGGDAGEYGAATGRPRKVGAFDVIASRYGASKQGADCIALTNLDVLSYMDKIPVCVAYDIDGERVMSFPSGARLARAKPIFEYLPGWKTDIREVRRLSDLPTAALDYVRFVEKAVNTPIRYISVGPIREAVIYVDK